MADVSKRTLVELPHPPASPEPVIAVYHVPTSARLLTPPVAPSLFQYMEMCTPDFLDGACAPNGPLQLLGKLVAVTVGQEGLSVAHFVQHPGHPKASVEGEQSTFSLSIPPYIVDAIVNGGVVTHEDNICYGLTENGALSAFIAYVEIGG